MRLEPLEALPLAVFQGKIPIKKTQSGQNAGEGEKGGQNDCVRASHVDPNEGWGQQEQDYGDELPAARPERAGFFSVSLIPGGR